MLKESYVIWFDHFITFSNHYFRPVFLLVTSAFAIYFAYKKIGIKVSAQYSAGGKNFMPMHITEVVLSNKKDKPVNVYAIYAVFHNDLWLELDKYSPPIVLKPYESLTLTMNSYSFLSVGSDKYEPDFSNAKIHIESDDKVIKCKSRHRPELLYKYDHVSKNTFSHNGFIYDETVSYILVYVLNSTLKTAFIHKSGYIGNEWDFNPNHLGEKATELNILRMLNAYKFHDVFSSHTLYRVKRLGVVEEIKA